MNILRKSLFNTIFCNPVMTKELRQTVKGAFTVFGVNILLLALLLCTFIVFSNYADEHLRNRNEAIGKEFFGAVLIILSIIIWGIMPLNQYFRTSNERNPDDPDLMYITNMSPAQIVIGKYLTAFIQVFLYVGMCLPFLALPYLFEGIDIYTMFRAVVQVSIAGVLVFQISLLLASLPKKKFLLWIFAAIFSGMVFLMIIIMVEEMLPGVYRYYGSKRPDPLWNKYALSVVLLISFFIYILNHAFMKPDTANRALWPRLAFNVLWLLSFGIFVYLTIFYKHEEYMVIWCGFAIHACMICMLFSISERDQISSRITKTIPKSLLRFFVFPLYSGSAGGILWSLIMLIITIFAGWGTLELLSDIYSLRTYSELDRVMEGFCFSGVGVFSHCMAVYFFTRLLKTRDLKKHSWFIAIILAASSTLIITFMIEEFNYNRAWYVLCPYGPLALAENYRGDFTEMRFFSEILLSGLLILFYVISLRYTLPQIFRFRYYKAPPLVEIIGDVAENVEGVA